MVPIVITETTEMIVTFDTSMPRKLVSSQCCQVRVHLDCKASLKGLNRIRTLSKLSLSEKWTLRCSFIMRSTKMVDMVDSCWLWNIKYAYRTLLHLMANSFSTTSRRPTMTIVSMNVKDSRLPLMRDVRKTDRSA